MEVIIAEHAGFCFGVKRAVKMAFTAAESKEKSVHTLGPLIHNPQVVGRLSEQGVEKVDSLTEINDGIVILRSHGVASPQVAIDAKSKGLTVIDATCPFVTNAQRYAKLLVDEGYLVIMVGDRHHPETLSVLGHAGGDILVTEDFDEIQTWLNRFANKKRVGVISQTTQTFQKFSDVVSLCLKLCEEVKVFNTICYATEERQDEAEKIAREVQSMVVVGGKNSANTTHLADICRQEGIPVYHIETAGEIKNSWFNGIQRTGVTAGASTPDWIIKEVVEQLQKVQ
ncbi:MAG: 4-hydroxy-3-methylbut-2-enyl diphosphate reductase [Nitrospirae bacterium]|nr:4-hydroxy-3-methylbut-2-enyl diphosphate reductase [Candidatus Troglogloeales bacterium]MBI3599002.1 4-hydroxy-3-methylbut-2-enyl diphosphate reductase [Candidatus Troglogloeales bacterium]